MKATEILKEEHRAIRKMLDVIDKICENLSSNREVPVEDLEGVVEFIRTFADRCHHSKEEDILFIALEDSGVPREGGPVGVMLMEHQQGRAYVKGMAEGISALKNGEESGKKMFIENVLTYRELLDQHIYKEDNILYQIAEIHIPGERLHKMVDEFEEAEKVKVGEGVHQKMHDLLHHLIENYLNNK
jgi:hemerythrin-like domain-containing protein